MPETPQAKQAADIFIVAETDGKTVQFKTYPSPAIIRPGATKIRFRNFCTSDVELDLSDLPVTDPKLMVGANGQEASTSLAARAKAGFYLYTATLKALGAQAIGGSSPKVIIDI
ncbi:MAG: hypothetical protein QM311_10650 [Acidobacteriota bacterium]|jgi:hypothetical protein|nr:hypothetical protein [Acidobacteriota bacterium]